ncbi:ribonuclease H-like domain-containing protein [Tanacetum coccineum]
MDLCGPMRVASVNGKKYILVIVDDYSRFTWVKFLASKDEALDFIIKFLKMIQVRLNATIRNIRTDNGTKFVNQTLCSYYESVGISHETSVARTPQKNGVVERRKRKLQAKADIGIFIGYAPKKNAYRIYNRRTRKIIETIHVNFDELTAMASEQLGSGPVLQLMTPSTSSSGLVSNPIPQQPCNPPQIDDWDWKWIFKKRNKKKAKTKHEMERTKFNRKPKLHSQVIQNAVQNPGVQNVGNQNGLIVVPGIANHNPNGNGNVVATRAEGNANGNNGNQIRCYNYKGLGHLARNCIVRPKRRDVAYLKTQLLIAQKKEVGIQLPAKEFDLMATAADLDEIEEVNANCILMANLQQASTSGTQTNISLVNDSDGSAEVHHYDNFYNNDIFNMFTQEEQYTELLEPIPEPHQV